MAANKEYLRAYYARNKARMLAQNKRRYENNQELILAKQKEYCDRNREAVRLRNRVYARATRAQRRAYAKVHYEKNRVTILASQREYTKSNRAKINERQRRKRETDINFRLRQTLHTRMWMAISQRGGKKSLLTIELIGCEVEFLRDYLQVRFTTGMNWGNIGKWHIDHVIPCAEFDLRDIAQQRQCFHYSNLRPLWAGDNLKKGRTLPATHQAELI